MLFEVHELFLSKIAELYEIGVIDNLWSKSEPEYGYNDSIFENLILESETEKKKKQYFEYTDRPLAATKSVMNRNYDLDIFSI